MKYSYKYFPVSETQRKWGLYATCAGHSRSEPFAPFPSHAHPDEYFFTWEKGRVLNEWQIILLEGGSGTVEFRKRRFAVRQGSLIVLPPGCWHRYRPEKKTGWTTFWLGFGGDLVSRFAGGAGFNPDGEVRELGTTHRFRRLFADAVSGILDNRQSSLYSTAAQVPPLVAALADGESRTTSDAIQAAQTHIMEHSCEIVDFAALAESLGIPYRTFRYLFTKETGESPLQFQLSIRLARAKNLLASSDMPIAEIAETLGFNSTWYFSHFFAKATSVSPREYRRHPSGSTVFSSPTP